MVHGPWTMAHGRMIGRSDGRMVGWSDGETVGGWNGRIVGGWDGGTMSRRVSRSDDSELNKQTVDQSLSVAQECISEQ